MGYVSPDNNVLDEYQEYFEYVIRRLQLENPSNYEQVLLIFWKNNFNWSILPEPARDIQLLEQQFL